MTKLVWSDLLVPAYVVGVVGAFLQISGGFWDVSGHIMGIVETFFTVPHMVLYTGVVLSLLASVTGLALRRPVGNKGEAGRTLLAGFTVSLAGGLLQVIAGPFDFWWHSAYGFDPHLFTPSHSILIGGIILNGVGMGIATIRLVQANRTGVSFGKFTPSTRWLQVLAVAALTTVWLDLNGLVYLVTDVNGLNYTFHFGDAWVEQAAPVGFVAAGLLLAGVGSLVFLAVKKALPWAGAVSGVALLGALVVVTANLGFRAWYLTNSLNANDVAEGNTIASFIPLYLSFLVPVVVFDLVVKNPDGRRSLLAASLVAPFASFLDGFYSLPFWTGSSVLVPILVLPMLAAGAVGAAYKTRFVNVFSSNRLSLIPARVEMK